MNIVQRPSPNFNKTDRNGMDWLIAAKLIVAHWSVGSYQSAVGWFLKPEAQVSAHFVINESGDEVSQMVDLNRRAWHCGGSWHCLLSTDTNAETIGIELAGPPSSLKQTSWNPQQISTLVDLCKYIKQQVPTIIGIVDHSTIDPLHKSDVKKGTGVDLFPWDDFISRTGMLDFTKDYTQLVKAHFGIK